MSIRLSDVGRLGIDSTSTRAQNAAAASAVMQSAVSAGTIGTGSQGAGAFRAPTVARTTTEMIAAPTSGASSGAPNPKVVEKFKANAQYVEIDSLRALTAAAQKGEPVTIFATMPGRSREDDTLSASDAKAVMSLAFDEIMRRGASTTADAGKITQSGDSGQTTTELAPPASPSDNPAAGWDAPTAPKKSNTKTIVGLSVGLLVVVGAFMWMRSKKSGGSSMPEQVQGWFDGKRRKRRR